MTTGVTSSGVVWRARPRGAALTVCLAVGVVPLLGATPATAAVPGTAAAPGTVVVPVPVAVPASAPAQADLVGARWGDERPGVTGPQTYGSEGARRNPGSLFTVTSAVGARQAWAQEDVRGRALTGRGVTVAVLDSGVAPVPGLDAPGKVVQGPDLSLEADRGAAPGPDTFGHGTHMASIIGASDEVPRDPAGEPTTADAGRELGVAPDAQLLALKLAARDGSTDVSQVIAGLDWVAAHRRDNGMDVRVVNLSFGTTTLQPYQLDPLAAAAENAWRHGLVVVVSGGNGGDTGRGLTNPAIDPYVLAVGASDPRGHVEGWEDPAPADFSARGTGSRAVDLVAPGRSIVGLRAPGSYADTHHPEGLVPGDATGRLFRGSGTSQAAAVVSGAAALLLQAHPDLTPDAVKAALVRSAQPGRHLDPLSAGAGQLDVAAALDEVRRAKSAADPSGTLLAARQDWPVATGTGSLEAARGGAHVADPLTGRVLQGEVDAQGRAFDAAAWSRASAAGTAWSGGEWMRARWSGDTWTSDGWTRARWSGAGWERARWSRARWSEAAWERARWSRARWSEAAWERARWSRARWSEAGWERARWSRARWSDAGWERARWSDAGWERARWSASSWSDAGWERARWSASSWSASSWSASSWS